MIKTKRKKHAFTKVGYYSCLLATLVQTILGYTYRNNWGDFAYFQAFITLSGTELRLILYGEGLVPNGFNPFDPNTWFYAGIIVVCDLAIQITVNKTLSVADEHRALYYLACAVGEEVFFRGALMGVIIFYLRSKTTLPDTISNSIAIIIQAGFFAALHVHYYGDYKTMTGVFLSGVAMGAVYNYSQNIESNIIAHMFINLIVIFQRFGPSVFLRLVFTGSEFTTILMGGFIIIIIGGCVALALIEEGEHPQSRQINWGYIKFLVRVKKRMIYYVGVSLCVIILTWYSIREDIFIPVAEGGL